MCTLQLSEAEAAQLRQRLQKAETEAAALRAQLRQLRGDHEAAVAQLEEARGQVRELREAVRCGNFLQTILEMFQCCSMDRQPGPLHIFPWPLRCTLVFASCNAFRLSKAAATFGSQDGRASSGIRL